MRPEQFVDAPQPGRLLARLPLLPDDRLHLRLQRVEPDQFGAHRFERRLQRRPVGTRPGGRSLALRLGHLALGGGDAPRPVVDLALEGHQLLANLLDPGPLRLGLRQALGRHQRLGLRRLQGPLMFLPPRQLAIDLLQPPFRAGASRPA